MDEDLDRLRTIKGRAKRVSSDLTNAARDVGDVADLMDMTVDALEHARQGEFLPPNVGQSLPTYRYLGTLEASLGHLERQTYAIRRETPILLGTATTMASTTASAIGQWVTPDTEAMRSLGNLEKAIDTRLRRPDIETKLANIDSELVARYRQAWQQVTLPGPDQGRPALGAVRQLWDELFTFLAPNETVQGQPSWEPSDPAKPRQVTRRDRLNYVLERLITEPRRQESLRAQLPAHLEIRDQLDRLHTRGELDSNLALRWSKDALAVIHQWVEAVTPPSGRMESS